MISEKLFENYDRLLDYVSFLSKDGHRLTLSNFVGVSSVISLSDLMRGRMRQVGGEGKVNPEWPRHTKTILAREI